jgi:hypothetical protein
MGELEEEVGASVHRLMRESDDLVRDWGTKKSPALIEEMITTRAEDRARRNDRRRSQVDQPLCQGDAFCSEDFAPFKHLRKVVVFGSARSAQDSPDFVRTDTDRFGYGRTGGPPWQPNQKHFSGPPHNRRARWHERVSGRWLV